MVRRTSLVLTMLVAGLFSAYAGSIRGVVEDNAPRPNPVPGAVVMFIGTSGGGAIAQYSDTTDQTGRYQIGNVENGTYAIRVSKAGYTPDPDNDPTARVSNSTPNAVVDLVLIPRPTGTTITGTVTDSLTNANLVGAKLLLQQRTMMTWSTVDSTASSAAGAYTFDSIAAGAYRIQASIAGYATKLVPVTVTAQAQTITIKLVPAVTGKISGTVTDSLTNANLNGATLVLQEMAMSGWAAVDTITAANGTYTFDGLDAGTYRIRASLTGYATKTTANIAVAGSQTQTVDIKLVPVQTGKIIGKILADSAKGAAIAAATVILERVSFTTPVAIDTVTTDTNGDYAFDAVEVGLNYDVTASKAGYVDRTVRINRKSAGTDTANMVLTKLATGSIYVKVMKQKDSALITGATATVVRTMGGTSLTGTTGANGIAAFVDLATGTFTITVAAAGFNPMVRNNYRLVANAKDTLLFYLAAATAGTKTFVGTVTDSATKAAVPNARVALVIQYSGGAITLVDSTDASGNYVISGIPVTVFMGSVAGTCTGYRNYTNSQVTLGQPGQADTARLNFVMRKITAEIIPGGAANSVSGKPEIRASGANLVLRNFNDNGVISLFSPNGKLLYRADFRARTTSFALPGVTVHAGGIYVVSITQKNAVYRHQVVMP